MKPGWFAILATFVLVAGCGGSKSSGSPTSPSPSTGNTITITASGVSPRELTISAGSRVTFVNNDSRSHTMNSDPHPEHGGCPPIDQVGFIAAGQSKQTGNFVQAGTCGYHDHDRDQDTSLQGRIIVR